MLLSAADTLNHCKGHFSSTCGVWRCFLFYQQCKGQTGWGCIESQSFKKYDSAPRWPMVELSHRGSPLHTRIPCLSERPTMTCNGLFWQLDQTSVKDKRQTYCRQSTLGLPFSFNSFDPSKDLQSLLFKCYFFFYQNDKTIHEYSCTSSTYPDSNDIIMCMSSTQNVNEEAIFHIIIVLSVIDRNKSMQYSSLDVIFQIWHHPWEEVSGSALMSLSGF